MEANLKEHKVEWVGTWRIWEELGDGENMIKIYYLDNV